MVESGSYTVNGRKDSSLKSFICALLAFLAMLILIALLLFAFTSKGRASDNSNSNNETSSGNSEKLVFQGSTVHLTETTTTSASTHVSTTVPPSDASTGSTADIATFTVTTSGTSTADIITTSTVTSLGTSTSNDSESTSSATIFDTSTIKDSVSTSSTSLTTTASTTESKLANTVMTSGTSTTIQSTTAGKRQATVFNTVTSLGTSTSNDSESTSSATIFDTSTIKDSVSTSSTSLTTTASTTESKLANIVMTSGTSTTIQSSTSGKRQAPETCDKGVCRTAASTMLATMSHDGNIDCVNPYKFVCGGVLRKENRFLEDSYREFIREIQDGAKRKFKYMEMFSDFHESCNKFGHSLNRAERFEILNGTETKSLTECATKMILTQTMPFFDVGMNIQDKKFVLEITLPGLSYLKTTLKKWSLVDQLENNCIEVESEKERQGIVDLDEVSNNIKNCIKEKTSSQVDDFRGEMDSMKNIPSLSFLKNNVDAPANSSDLRDILNIVQESKVDYHKTNDPQRVTITLDELSADYNFGLDWIELFKGITNRQDVSGAMTVYWTKHLDKVFRKLKEKETLLKELLDLWYNIELFQNTITEGQGEKVGYHCLDITSQLMPDVSASLISKLNDNKKDLYTVSENIFQENLDGFYKNAESAKWTAQSLSSLQMRKDEIKLVTPLTIDVDQKDYENLSFDVAYSYQKKLISLMTNYRHMLYSLNQKEVTGQSLLKYFVNAFETEPISFPPSRLVVYQPGFVQDISNELPKYVKNAKLGLPLAEQISLHFTEKDFDPPLSDQDLEKYDDMESFFDAKYLFNNATYLLENDAIEIKDINDNKWAYKEIFADIIAFGINNAAYANDESQEYLTFLKEFTREKSFIIIALQGMCGKNTLMDFYGDYYNKRLPLPIKMRNIVKNSKFIFETFECPGQFVGEQFPNV